MTVEHTIKSKELYARIDTMGAQLQSLQLRGLEYLWQGDARYWQRRAPLLFPFVGRLLEERYLLNGQSYSMAIHGFLSHREFRVGRIGRDYAEFFYEPDAATRECYPFLFRFEIVYCLREDRLEVEVTVRNSGDSPMPFALGWHPGFRVPLEEPLCFEDYFLQFDPHAVMRRVVFSGRNLITGESVPFCPEGNRLPMRHAMFDRDAIVLRGSGGRVRLAAARGRHGICMEYPNRFYLGLWHRPHTDAPYVCIEPWSALPGQTDRILRPERCPDFCLLPVGETYRCQWAVALF